MWDKSIAAVVLLVLTPGIIHGLGLRIPDQDPKAIARGNAFVATADNPSAVFYNPAGITQLEGRQVSFSAYAITLGSQHTAPNGVRTDTEEKLQAVPQVYCTFSAPNRALAFGVGVYCPYGLGLEWPDNSPFRTVATRGQLRYFTATPVVAWRIHPTFSLAAGPSVSYAETDLRRGLLPVGAGDQFKFKGDDTDAGYHVGLLWQPHPKHSFGLTYRSTTTMNFKGHSYVTGPPPIIPVWQPASARFAFPQQIVAGYSFRPTSAWNLEFNADWTDWDRLDTITLQQVPVMRLPFYWESSFMYEWGITRYLKQGFSASAGYMFSQSSVPAASFSPAVPDSDRHIFSFGLGQQYKWCRWDTAYQFAYGPPRSINNSVNGPTVAGRYRFISHALALTIRFTY